ncbi:Thymidylate kinase [Frankliniella fusca]|uniref:Thymidylate kinase n=1 Tax=Frankliniella fusca TaxID=407009 RepID=A0AAE1I3V8_9NEOP|nr:Thymidylate kinase [Frankliniella fusca]
MMGRRGVLFVFEGCDRAGKTTQCRMLVDALCKRGIPAEYMNFPDRSTAIGKIINDYLLKKVELPDKAVHLLFSANRWELEPVIKNKLASGVSLIVDRYSYSGVAFSAAKKGMDLKWCWNPEIGLPEPDAVLLLNLTEEVSAKRGDFGLERYEATDFQRKVKSNFMDLKDSLWKIIDADKPVENLHVEILDIFNSVYESSAGKPITVLKAN